MADGKGGEGWDMNNGALKAIDGGFLKRVGILTGGGAEGEGCGVGGFAVVVWEARGVVRGWVGADYKGIAKRSLIEAFGGGCCEGSEYEEDGPEGRDEEHFGEREDGRNDASRCEYMEGERGVDMEGAC